MFFTASQFGDATEIAALPHFSPIFQSQSILLTLASFHLCASFFFKKNNNPTLLCCVCAALVSLRVPPVWLVSSS